MKLSLDRIKIGRRYRKDMGDLPALAASMDAVGLLQPVVVTPEHRLIAGERRIRAARALGWAEIDAVEVDIESILEGEYAENEVRKDFTPSERVAIGKAIEKEIGNRAGRPSKSADADSAHETRDMSSEKRAEEIVQNFAQFEPGVKTREVAAEKAGFGNPETYRQAKKVVDSGDTEVIAAMDSGEVSISAAAKEVDRRKTEANGHAPKPGGPVDKLGIPIQPHAAEAFEAVPLFKELLDLLRKADRLYSKIADMPGGAYLTRPGVSENNRERWRHKGIRNAIMCVEDSVPTYTECPRIYHDAAFPDARPEPHGEKCDLCHGLNWSRPVGKNEVQAEVFQAMKEAHGV